MDYTREYIEDRVERIPESGCWIWMKSCQLSGYGDFRLRSGHWLAHRAAYELWNNPIPKGLQVCHKCDVRECVNPSHLFLGTNQDNIADSVAKGRRKGIPRKRPSGLKYNWSPEAKANWIESKRKVKASDREEIREAYALGALSQRQLAKRFGVSSATICYITKGIVKFCGSS